MSWIWGDLGGFSNTCSASWSLLWLGDAGQESCSSDEELTSWSLSSIATGATVHSAISNQKGAHMWSSFIRRKRNRGVMWGGEGKGCTWFKSRECYDKEKDKKNIKWLNKAKVRKKGNNNIPFTTWNGMISEQIWQQFGWVTRGMIERCIMAFWGQLFPHSSNIMFAQSGILPLQLCLMLLVPLTSPCSVFRALLKMHQVRPMSEPADKIICASCSYIMQSHWKFDGNSNTKVNDRETRLCSKISF